MCLCVGGLSPVQEREFPGLLALKPTMIKCVSVPVPWVYLSQRRACVQGRSPGGHQSAVLCWSCQTSPLKPNRSYLLTNYSGNCCSLVKKKLVNYLAVFFLLWIKQDLERMCFNEENLYSISCSSYKLWKFDSFH